MSWFRLWIIFTNRYEVYTLGYSGSRITEGRDTLAIKNVFVNGRTEMTVGEILKVLQVKCFSNF